jgi:hypothetical protein
VLFVIAMPPSTARLHQANAEFSGDSTAWKSEEMGDEYLEKISDGNPEKNGRRISGKNKRWKSEEMSDGNPEKNERSAAAAHVLRPSLVYTS